MSTDAQLPPGWARATLADCTTRITDGTHLPPTFTSEGVPFLFVKHIVGGAIQFEDTRFISQATYEELHARNKIEVGDILYSAVGSYGVAVPVVTAAPFSFQRHIAHVKPIRGLDQQYLVQYLNSEYGLSQAHQFARGVAQKTVTLGDLRKYVVRLAPLAEQRRIVAKVEELFAELDEAVTELERVRANLKRYRASLLKAAVSGELTADWRAKHPPTEPASALLTRILTDRRAKWEAGQLKKFTAANKPPPKNWQAKYAEPTAPDTSTLPPLPEGWTWASVEQLIALSEYGTSTKCDYNGRGQPVLRIPNIAAGEMDVSDLKYAIEPLPLSEGDGLQPGDLLVCRTNGSVSLIGKAAVVRSAFERTFYFASYLLRFRFAEAKLSPAWLHLYLSSTHGRRFIERNAASSAGQHNISLSLLHRMPVPLPPLAEQEAIVAEVEARLSDVSAAEETVTANLTRAARLRQSILKEAFAGRLVPQDPSDEPAAVLLERLHAGRTPPTRPASVRKRRADP